MKVQQAVCVSLKILFILLLVVLLLESFVILGGNTADA